MPQDESKAESGSAEAQAAGAADAKPAAATAATDSEDKPKGKCEWNVKGIDVIELTGEVVHGFGRGSKTLGIPTANLPPEVFEHKLDSTPNGVYFGWAQVDNGPVYKTVLSIGMNPYFKNTTRTVEPYIMHKFEDDFYGAQLRLAIVGFLRTQADFNSLEELIAAIHKDIEIADAELAKESYSVHASSALFKTEGE